MIEKLNLLNVNISNSTNENDLQSCLANFVNLIDDVAAPLFKKTVKYKDATKYESCFSKNKNPWFNEVPREKKISFHIC